MKFLVVPILWVKKKSVIIFEGVKNKANWPRKQKFSKQKYCSLRLSLSKEGKKLVIFHGSHSGGFSFP